MIEVGHCTMKLYDYHGRYNLSGIRIREKREALHMSQEGLARALQLEGMEVTQKTISRIEKGLRVVPDFELKYFSAALHEPVEWFLEE